MSKEIKSLQINNYVDMEIVKLKIPKEWCALTKVRPGTSKARYFGMHLGNFIYKVNIL